MSDYLTKGEQIRRIKNCPDYAVSNLGNVYHVYPSGRLKRLKGGVGKNGYKTFSIYYKTYVVHREVAKAFLPAPKLPNITVNHKNGIKTDNRVENLEWVTRQENTMHSIYVLGNLCQPVIAYDADGRVKAVAASLKQLEEIGFQHQKVSDCLYGKRKTHHGCTFRRLSIQEYNSYVGRHFCLGHKFRYNYENV